MKRAGYKDVLVSISELVGLNPAIKEKEASINVCMSRNRNGKSKSWMNITDTVDRRISLIYYNTIPSSFKAKYQLPEISSLIDSIKKEVDFEKFNEKQIKIDFVEIRISDALNEAADKHYIKFCPKYLSLFPEDQDKVITYARTHSVIGAILELRKIYKVKTLHNIYCELKGLKNIITSYNAFAEKLEFWHKNGINLVHAKNGKTPDHLVKVTDFHIGKMEQYYSHPNKYTYLMISEMVNKDCAAIGLKTISVESVKRYLMKPEVKNRLSYYRSKEFYKKNIEPFSRRKSALFSGDLYYADGSPIQIFSWNKSRTKVIRINLFAVMDVKSSKIVGFDLSETEDRYNWFSAFKMAFDMESILPYEIVYDNASATKTAEFIALQDALLLRGCRLNPAGKGNPQHKSQMERWFETFQSGYQRMIDGFIGEGIRSKRDNGRIDPEFYAKVQKQNGHYTWESMIMIITQLIAIYNQKAVKNRKAPSLVFAESDKPNANPIGKEQLALMFWHSKKLKVNRGEVKTTIRHNDYYYEVYDHNTALAINGQEINMFYDEKDLSRVHIFSLHNEYLGELRQKIGFHLAKANQSDNDVLQIMKESKHNASIVTTIKKITAEKAESAANMNSDAFYNVLNPFTAAKEDFNTSETKMMMDYIKDNAGLNENNINEPVPVDFETPLNKIKDKKPLETRYSKQFQDNNPSLQVVGEI